MDKKRVLIATPVLLIGGTEVQTLSMVRVLVEAGYYVGICCYYEFDPSIVHQFEEAGAKPFLLRLDRSGGGFGPRRICELSWKLIGLFREYCPDILHVQYLAPGLVPIVAARLARVPTIFATVHRPGRVCGLKAKIYLRSAARLCTAFFCVSQAVESSWFGDSKLFDPREANLKRKHFAIYNGVDVDQIARYANSPEHASPLRNELGIAGRLTVGIVGRLRKEKGQGVLLEALAHVVRAIPSTCLIVIGDGPDHQGLQDKANRLGLANHVLWLGKKKPEDLYALYGLMDVVVVPSIFEGFGLSAAEAMAAGRPVVASAVDGLRELVQDGITGYLVPPSDSTSLAKAVINLLSDRPKARAMGEEGRRTAIFLFGMDRFSESVLAAYRLFSRGN